MLVFSVRCEVPDTGRQFYELDTVQLDKPTDLPRAADVVFVIQHAPCNTDLMSKVSAVVDSLDQAMRSQHLTSIRYAVVGFGGKQLHLADAHVHTMDGQVFNSANKVSNTLRCSCHMYIVVPMSGIAVTLCEIMASLTD